MGELSPRAAAAVLAGAQAAARGALQPAKPSRGSEHPNSSCDPDPDRESTAQAAAGASGAGRESDGNAGVVGAAARVGGFLAGMGGDGVFADGASQAGWEARAAALSEAVREALAQTQARSSDCTCSSHVEFKRVPCD